MPEIVRSRSGEYFIVMVRTSPTPFGDGATSYPTMYPSFWRTSASATFCFEDGILTRSCIAVLALRTRVSMSAMGSVIMVVPPSPTALRQTGDLAGVGQVAQADAAQAELAEHGAGPTTATATGVAAHLELGLRGGLVDQCLLCHLAYFLLPPRTGPRPRRRCLGAGALGSSAVRNGNPKASSRALPAASSVAVVTIVMSMPRGMSILS